MRRIPFGDSAGSYEGDWMLVDEEGSCDALHPRHETPRWHRYRIPVLDKDGLPITVARVGWNDGLTVLRALRCPESLTTEQFRAAQDAPRT